MVDEKELAGFENWRKVPKSYMDILILKPVQTAELIGEKLFVDCKSWILLSPEHV